MANIIVFGDIHGKWRNVNSILEHERDSSFALSTGDLCSYELNSKKNLIFCYGNHENFNYISELMLKRNNLIALSSGEIYKINGINILAFPGVYSPHFFESGEKLKYYSKKNLEKMLSINEKIDILLTHEAPQRIGVIKNENDLGKEHISQIIEHLNPRIVFFGHHHIYHEANLNGIPIFGLDIPHHSYIKLNMEDFSIKRIESNLNSKMGYQYSWEKKSLKC